MDRIFDLQKANEERPAWLAEIYQDFSPDADPQQLVIKEISADLAAWDITSSVMTDEDERLRLEVLNKIMNMQIQLGVSAHFCCFTFEMLADMLRLPVTRTVKAGDVNAQLAGTRYVIPDQSISHYLAVSGLRADIDFGLNDLIAVPADLDWAYIYGHEAEWRRTLLDFKSNDVLEIVG